MLLHFLLFFFSSEAVKCRSRRHATDMQFRARSIAARTCRKILDGRSDNNFMRILYGIGHLLLITTVTAAAGSRNPTGI